MRFHASHIISPFIPDHQSLRKVGFMMVYVMDPDDFYVSILRNHLQQHSLLSITPVYEGYLHI